MPPQAYSSIKTSVNQHGASAWRGRYVRRCGTREDEIEFKTQNSTIIDGKSYWYHQLNKWLELTLYAVAPFSTSSTSNVHYRENEGLENLLPNPLSGFSNVSRYWPRILVSNVLFVTSPRTLKFSAVLNPPTFNYHAAYHFSLQMRRWFVRSTIKQLQAMANIGPT